jgi:hypothetical protein
MDPPAVPAKGAPKRRFQASAVKPQASPASTTQR